MGGRGRLKGLGSQHVLVVEDDEPISKLLMIVLEQAGYVVKVAKDTDSATNEIQASLPSLVLLDVGLPDGSGLDFLRWMRDDAGINVPVIVVSAFRQEDTVSRAFELGANDFVAKPFRPKELIQRIQRVMDV